MPLTGNPMVDAMLIDNLRAALSQACEENAHLKEKLAAMQERETYWEEISKKSERKAEGMVP
jgi:hypothetical protein